MGDEKDRKDKKVGDPFAGLPTNPLDTMGLLGAAGPPTEEVQPEQPAVEKEKDVPAPTQVEEPAEQNQDQKHRRSQRAKKSEPAQEPVVEITGKQQLSCQIDAQLMYQIDCILDHAPGMRKKVVFVERALKDLVEKFEKEHGGPFPPPVNNPR